MLMHTLWEVCVLLIQMPYVYSLKFHLYIELEFEFQMSAVQVHKQSCIVVHTMYCACVRLLLKYIILRMYIYNNTTCLSRLSTVIALPM